MSNNIKEGFRVGNYFCTFPPGDFVTEDKDGNMFVAVDIFKIDSDNKTTKVGANEITPELEEQIGLQINAMLEAAVEQGMHDVKD